MLDHYTTWVARPNTSLHNSESMHPASGSFSPKIIALVFVLTELPSGQAFSADQLIHMGP